MAPNGNTSDHSNGSFKEGSGAKETKKKVVQNQASIGETLGYVFGCGPLMTVLFVVGSIAGFLNGLVYPILAYLFSTSFSDISASASEGLSQIRQLAFTFMIVGTYALFAGGIQNWAFAVIAFNASQRFRLTWFKALLRQDPAYFDVHDVAGIANQVGPNANKFRRGIGRKFGEGIQFLTTGLGGFAYAFYSSWRVALVVLTVIPFVSLAALSVMTLNTTKGQRAANSYKKAGGVAYTAVSAIKTVLSLNAIPEMIRQYTESTLEAYKEAIKVLIKQGLANGSMLGSFLGLYCILTLYGTSLFYKDVKTTGCDPSDGVEGNATCESSGPDVFGAMLGIAFAAQGISQFGNFSEAFTAARVAVYEAHHAINRVPGASEEVIYRDPENDVDMLATTTRSAKSKASEKEAVPVVKAILPKYEIDSTSMAGSKPEIKGHISVKDVHFSYPTRPQDPILKGMSVEISAGQTVAFVGPSGGGKSTIVSLLERFYDPASGSIEIDGINIKNINVKHLRSSIGYVGQEPTLFATSIRGNIRYGKPNATDKEIEAAARMANAHDFIMSFTDGYDTQVGDKGSQLSGGQKQRIAIARVLVGNPRILLLDEATSALDSESELVVQDALDNILQHKNITTIIIAHRLSTIRSADVINVIHGGKVVESGTHGELMQKQDYYYRLVQKQENNEEGGDSGPSSRNSSSLDLTKLDDAGDTLGFSTHPGDRDHIEFIDVHFSYPTRPKKKVFENFNLKIRQGQTVALVGPSGQGKSTTVGLIERFYDPSEGCVAYLGHDIRTLNLTWYRDQIGYVGQEPTLFKESIARNIAYGYPGATQAEIEEAAKQANAHDFIMSFPEGYNTPVGERGSQLSGGQKQRIAIARALVKKPKILILDEATSALDNESEAIVQQAIDKLMTSRAHTVILIAHRLSTVRNADKIAYIGHGKVLEYGSHDELIQKPHGLYKRLFESSKQKATLESVGLRKGHDKVEKEDEEEEEDIDWEAKIKAEEEAAFDSSRARNMAKPDAHYILLGSIGAIMAGGVFPMWGLLFSETMNLLFDRVEPCTSTEQAVLLGFDNCNDYWLSKYDYLREQSFKVGGYWLCLFVGCIIGNVFTYVGFGTASERLNKRIRDTSFIALMRQEVGYFDKRSVGSITSQLQDDAARIHAFSGEPVRSFLTAVASVVTGITLSFVYMWQFALVAIGCVPVMGFATSLEMKKMLGEDIGDINAADGLATPGGIIVETLLNIRTVSALTLEQSRFDDYERALLSSEPNIVTDCIMDGVTGGISMFVQQWVNALQMWFGGYLLFTYPEDYQFKDFLIANFASLFSLFGLGAAFQDISDRKEVEKSAGRVFYLLDLESKIDPLSTEGEKLADIVIERVDL